jgi:hypothetical protein
MKQITGPSLTDRFRPPAAKTCRICKIEKPIKEFSMQIKNSDGRTHECRSCKKEHEDKKKAARIEHAKTFFDEKFFTLTLAILFSASLSCFSQEADTTQPLREYNWSGATSMRLYHNPDGSFEFRYPDAIPDTLRAICLVTLHENGIAAARKGFVVIAQGKRPVYLDCNKKALKLPQVGWDFREVDPNK